MRVRGGVGERHVNVVFETEGEGPFSKSNNNNGKQVVVVGAVSLGEGGNGR